MSFAKVCSILLLSTCTFYSCGKDTASNGTGSNAGETEIAKHIEFATVTGKPFVNAAARIWRMDQDSMEIEWSGVIDSKGSLDVNQNLIGHRLLEAHSGDSLSVMCWVDFGKQLSQTLAAVESASLKGNIKNNGAAVVGATVKILDKEAVTNENGDFTIAGLPQGVHYAYVEGVFGKFTYQMQTGLADYGTTNDIDISDSIFTVIEDFENWDDRQTLIGKSFGGGIWFVCTDSLQGGGSHSSGTVFSKNIVVTGDSAKNGSSLHVVFDLDEDYDGHYGVAGFSISGDFDLQETPAFFDLRGTSSISFDAKGSGYLFLQVTKRSSEGSKEFHKTRPVYLTQEWKRFTFDENDFRTELYDVNSINFMFEDDAELYLDNIRLNGISPAMWPYLSIDHNDPSTQFIPNLVLD